MSQLMAQGLNYRLPGALPFGQPGNPVQGAADLGGALGIPGLQGLANQYGQSYQAALQQNQALYNNILQGYTQLLGNQQQAQQPIAAGYQNLQNQVMGTIQNVGGAQKQAIIDAYAKQAGGLQQSLVNSGLGNTTVTGSMMRGVNLDEAKAQNSLADQIAQLQAGYQSNLGLAGLNYANQANMQNTALGQSELNWMNTVQAQYPNSGEYNALFGQAGQFGQMNADRALQQQLMRSRGLGGGQGGAGQLGAGNPNIRLPYANPLSGGSMFGAQDYSGLPGAGGGGGGQNLMGRMPGLGGGSGQALNLGGNQSTGFYPLGGGASMGGGGGYGGYDYSYGGYDYGTGGGQGGIGTAYSTEMSPPPPYTYSGGYGGTGGGYSGIASGGYGY